MNNFRKMWLMCVACACTVLLGSVVWSSSASAEIQSPPARSISELFQNDIVSFGGKNWIMLDASERKMILQTPSNTSFWNIDYQYDYDWGTSSSIYKSLHGNALFANLTTEEQSWLEMHQWNVKPQEDYTDGAPLFSASGSNSNYGGQNGEISAPVGLLTYNEFMFYKMEMEIDLTIPVNWYLITPYIYDSVSYGIYIANAQDPPDAPSNIDTGVGVRYVDADGLVTYHSHENLMSFHNMYLRPVIHLIDSLYVTGGEGTTNEPYQLGMPAAEMSISPSGPTNGSVTVELTFPPDSTDHTYRVGMTQQFNVYTGPFEVMANDVIEAAFSFGGMSVQNVFYINNIDTDAPYISGVVDGALYTHSVIPFSYDYDIASVALIKDGISVQFQLGDALAQNGAYVLTAVDVAGNETTVAFTIHIAGETGVAPHLISASTDVTGEWIALKFDVALMYQGIQFNLITFSGDAPGTAYTGYVLQSSPNVLLVNMGHAPVHPGDAVTVHVGAGAVFGQGEVGNEQSGALAVDNMTISPGDNGRFDIANIIQLIDAQIDVNFDGVFNSSDVDVLLYDIIRPMYSSYYY